MASSGVVTLGPLTEMRRRSKTHETSFKKVFMRLMEIAPKGCRVYKDASLADYDVITVFGTNAWSEQMAKIVRDTFPKAEIKTDNIKLTRVLVSVTELPVLEGIGSRLFYLSVSAITLFAIYYIALLE